MFAFGVFERKVPERKVSERLIGEIVEKELGMFQAVNNQNGPSPCQERPEAFRLMRWMLFSAMQVDFLESYLADLETAEKSGRNLMVEKYARMDNLIPPVSEDMDKVAAITDVEARWVRELSSKYPATFPENAGMFRRYHSAELEMFSMKTLSLYEVRLSEALDKGENLARIRYENMAEKIGLPSLDEREADVRRQ